MFPRMKNSVNYVNFSGKLADLMPEHQGPKMPLKNSAYSLNNIFWTKLLIITMIIIIKILIIIVMLMMITEKDVYV